ncbi:MAG: VOC family protein [Kineosporiaceae bacterium]
MSEDRVTRTAAATHGTPLGWRYFDETLATAVPVTSLAHAATVAAALTQRVGPEADELLFLDLRPRAVLLRVMGVTTGQLGPAGLALVSTLSAEVAGLGLTTTPRPDPGAVPGSGAAAVHRIDLAIDALDIPALVPFWEAVLGYVRSPVCDVDLVDPFGSGPLVWFQQMDAPRPQRNRIHLDVLVGEDEAQTRVAAALAAGGRLLSDAAAPAFWVLADVEGNEACVCTWQGRSD